LQAIKKIEGKVISPLHLLDILIRFEDYKRTSTIAPRYHLKSTIFYGYLAWKLFRMEQIWNEWIYMSYTQDLAAYHTKRLKRYIDVLPQFFGQHQNLTDSESILYYKKDGRHFYCEPTGVLTFQRGKHPTGMLLDDILKDPQVKLDISQLIKIEKTFLEEIEQMPKEELHLVGTPQDQEDLFSKLETLSGWNCKRYDAIVDETKGIALWENNPNFCYKALMERKARIGDKAFMKEFRCMPVRGVEGFLNMITLDRIIKPRLKNYTLTHKPNLREFAYAGFDIGKKTHPSHLCVLGKDRKGRLIQLHSKWMDGWDYIDQLAYIKEIIKNFRIARLEYDDTRAEFEGFREKGELPGGMCGLAFTAKNKFTMATDLDRLITQDKIVLLNDTRQRRQLLNVDNDLKAVETDEGHGDCFFSLCLAVKAAGKGDRQMIYEIGG